MPLSLEVSILPSTPSLGIAEYSKSKPNAYSAPSILLLKTINGMVVVLALSMNANAGIFGDVGDWFSGAYEDTSDFVSHNPGISIGAGLVATSVAEPLALPWAHHSIYCFIFHIIITPFG
jgi:hypothetical protein